MLLRDPVHGLISFGAAPDGEARRRDELAGRLVVDLMDTPEVQRLRRIRALGMASLVFPGAEHSRFAHAVGSAHVMQRYLDRVRRLDSELPAGERVDAETGAIAMAAALLHDLGHGPLSHTFEDLLPGAPSHVAWTSRIILDPGTGVHARLRAFDAHAPAAVERLIHGESPVPHLARAVSGTFDVDRCDYLLRDSHMTGVRYGALDIDWLLASLRLHVAPGSTRAALAVDGDKGLTAVEGFFLARLHMYRQVYLHKAVRAAEVMLQALFRRLLATGAPAGTPPALAALLRGESIATTTYLELDDHALAIALDTYSRGDDPVLADLAARLRERRLYKTLRLRDEVDSHEVELRMHELMRGLGVDAARVGAVDRREVEAYVEDHALVVRGAAGRVQPLLDASPLLRALSRETFVHHRAVFPGEHRSAVDEALREFT